MLIVIVSRIKDSSMVEQVKSCPPESLFIIFNATYNDDQKKSHPEYIELSIQVQFSKRVL
jgi:hypothetical protein